MKIQELKESQDRSRFGILQRHLDNGVVFRDVSSTYIDAEAEIASGVVVGPNNQILGATRIGADAVLGPNNIIENCEISEGANILSSVLKNAKIGPRATVGPFAYLRPDSVVGEGCRIGDFVELKSAVIGSGSKVSHLTYVGDAELGENCNIGCGVIFANYDGEKKSRSRIGDECFIGSNCNIVAPVTVENRSYIAAGTTVTKDVEANSFIIGRVRQQKLNLKSLYRKK